MTHRRAFSALAALAALAPGCWGHGLLRRPRRRIADRDAGLVACPRCRAEPGAPCDRRTLGRYAQHRARVEAARTARVQWDHESRNLAQRLYRTIRGQQR